jgi:hypothetical protein
MSASTDRLIPWLRVVELCQEELAAALHVTARWTIEDADGGCTALVGRLPDGTEIIVTDSDGSHISPEPGDTTSRYMVSARRCVAGALTAESRARTVYRDTVPTMAAATAREVRDHARPRVPVRDRAAPVESIDLHSWDGRSSTRRAP